MIHVPRWDGPGQVHLWHAAIEADASLEGVLDILGDDERDRADRFRSERDRSDFVQRRAFARRVLARYLAITPTSVRFAITPLGRPVLESPASPRFSVSSTRGRVVVAVSRSRAVGVDIERIRPIDDTLGLATGLFAPVEVDRLRSVPPERLDERFLTLWTRKESYVKALGGGLSIPLDSFEVKTPETVVTGRIEGRHGRAPAIFRALDVPAGYVGAVALSGNDVTTIDVPAALAFA